MASVLWLEIKRRLRAGRAKDQVTLVALYAKPDFDISRRFASMLNTVFCTLTYSAGMPLLLPFASLCMWLNYWVDKLILLRFSRRPPHYYPKIAKQASQIMLFAVAFHCIGAIFMLGQPC